VTGPVPPGGEELREAIASAVFARLHENNPLYYDDAADELADALLPTVLALVEEQGRRRAAEELRAAAGAWHNADADEWAVVVDWLRARAAALAPENQEAK
jgi:hypothetical protein